MHRENATNVVGAFALALSDSISGSIESDPAGAAALVHLSKYPGCTIAALRVPLELTHSGCVRLVDRLEAAGCVERLAGDDGRSVAVHPTDKGRTLARKALRSRAQALDSIVDALTPSELDTLARIASKLLAREVDRGTEPLRICRVCDYEACTRCPMDE